MEELKKCPFCGAEAEVRTVNDNFEFIEEWEEEFYEYVGYAIAHFACGNEGCPIATYEDKVMGCYIYDTKEEAIEAWNRRCCCSQDRLRHEKNDYFCYGRSSKGLCGRTD